MDRIHINQRDHGSGYAVQDGFAKSELSHSVLLTVIFYLVFI
jgi:hypothetical protein